MIIVIADWFEVYDLNGIPTGTKEFIVSHGIDAKTGKTVILPQEHPRRLGAIWDSERGEFTIKDQHEH